MRIRSCSLLFSIITSRFNYIISEKEISFAEDTDRTIICPKANESWAEDFGTSSHNLASFSYGSVGKGVVEKLRDKDQTYYESVVDNMIMFNCDLDEKSSRCVNEDSPEAAKDWNDKCIVASDFSCPIGACERKSNCYWKTVVANEVRQKRYHDKEYAQAEELLLDWRDEESYIGGIIKFIIPGVAAAFICFILWTLYFLARSCCCCLWNSCEQCNSCSPVPKVEGYNICWEVRFPILLYFACLISVIFAGTLAFIGNEDISDACTNTFNYGRALMKDSHAFLDRSKQPLVNINDIADDAAFDSQKIFDDTDYVQISANKISSSFVHFGAVHSEGIDASGARSQFNKVVISFQDKIDPIVLDISSMLETLEKDVYANVDIIKIALSSAIDQIESLSNSTIKWENEIDGFEDSEYEYRRYRQGFVLALFIIALIFASIGYLSIIYARKYSSGWVLYILNITWIICALLGSLAFILASITLCASIFWYDSCNISNVITSDFEPLVGDSAAAGANACFDGTNLAVAYNVTDKLDFQSKLDEGLDVLKTVNISKEFNKVRTPLNNLQSMIDAITIDALAQFNELTSINNEYCPFQDIYAKENILEPWNDNLSKLKTEWILNSTGETGEYIRIANESNTDYFERIYTVGGKCTGSSCCLGNNCDVLISDWCNGGDDCSYLCNELTNAITLGYEALLHADTMEKEMTANLGVRCPTGYTCPTAEFVAVDQSETILSLISSYESNITKTAEDLVNLTSTSVGDAMEQIEDFLCNMDVSFVGDRYEQLEYEFCDTMFGGFTQISGALWAISILLEIIAIIASLLSIRLRGVSQDEVDDYYGGVKSLRRVDLYG